MDSVLVSSIIKSIVKQISSLTAEPPSLLPPESVEDLNKLFRAIKRIDAVLDDALKRSIREASVRLWLSKLKGIAYSADDALAKYSYEVLRAKAQAQNETRSVGHKQKLVEVTGLTSDTVALPIPDRIVGTIKDILLQFEEFSRDVDVFPTMISGDPTVMWLPQLYFIQHYSVHGREDDKEKIIKLLSDDGSSSSSSTDGVPVLPIVGLGGVGKTTLGRLVYNDERICQNFDLRGWVCVSENFDVVAVMRKILECLTCQPCNLTSLSGLQDKFKEVLVGKCVFLVLDDVRIESQYIWECLRIPFVSARSGKILVTTRNAAVASVVGTLPPYLLTFLPFEHCWSMFKEIAFWNVDITKNEKLLKIGREIVMKCRGWPLAVRTLACLLHYEFNEDKWIEILDCDLWKLDETSNVVLPSLRVGLDNMPFHLKLCFLFLTLFPKDYVFLKNDIIKLWCSGGLLQSQVWETAEVFGSMYFDELLHLLLIRQTSLDNGRNNGFVMHDLVHDATKHYVRKEFEIAKDGILPDNSRDVRYLSVHLYDLARTVDLQPLQKLRDLRMLQILHLGNKSNNGSVINNILYELFNNLKHLRILILRDVEIEELPESIGNLTLLRHLDLTNTGILRLPESICLLLNLEVLELMNCPLIELPRGITNLVKLWHINFDWRFPLCMPRGTGQLARLRTLPRLEVRRGCWHCSIGELKDLENLRGELCISGLNNVGTVEEPREANLRSKRLLKVLRFDCSSGPSLTCAHSDTLRDKVKASSIDEQVLESLQPHADLEELHIYEYQGSTFPSWLGDSCFTKLVKISLVGCGEGCKILPTLGQLPSLQSLSIKSMLSVQQVGREFCSRNVATKGFQSLQTLYFDDMATWLEWSGVEEDEFCSLRLLTIIVCPELRYLAEPLSSSLTKLVIKDCVSLTVIPFLPSLHTLTVMGQINEDVFYCLDLPRLGTLKVQHSKYVRSLPLNSRKLPSLELLVIHSCRKLAYVGGLGGLISLKILKISACKNLQFSLNERLPPLLQHIYSTDCPGLQMWKLAQESDD